VRMRYTKRDILALLAHLAHEADRITEAEFAVLLGVDLIEARDVLIAGRDLADERTAARARRVEGMRAELAARTADAATVADVAGPRGYDFVDGALARLFADGRVRSTGEVARAMEVAPDAAAQRLRRSTVVERVERGRWRLRALVPAEGARS